MICFIFFKDRYVSFIIFISGNLNLFFVVISLLFLFFNFFIVFIFFNWHTHPESPDVEPDSSYVFGTHVSCYSNYVLVFF